MLSFEAGWAKLCKSTWAQTFQSFRLILSMVLSFPRLSSTVPLPFPEVETYTPTSLYLPLLLPGYELFLMWLTEMDYCMYEKIFSIICSVYCHTKFSKLSVFEQMPRISHTSDTRHLLLQNPQHMPIHIMILLHILLHPWSVMETTWQSPLMWYTFLSQTVV